MKRLLAIAAAAWLALPMLLGGGAATAHQVSFSHVDIALTAQATAVRVQLPIKALLHEAPSSLPAGTGAPALRADPIPADQRTALAALVGRRLRLTAAGGGALPLTIETVVGAGDDVTVTARAAPVVGPLTVDANLFPADRLAKAFVTVSRDGALIGQYALDRADPAFTVGGQSLLQIVGEFLVLGARHIFIGPDHILFVVSLVLLGSRAMTQVKIITAFTIAHSLTLTLATFGVVSPPSRWVESLIALSIVLVGLTNLVQLLRGPDDPPSKIDLRPALAFGFGLVHGFGFAGLLVDMHLPHRVLASSLAAFNIGIELGQGVIVLTAAPLLWSLRRYAPPRVAQWVLVAVAATVVIIGAAWLGQRMTGV